MKRANYIPAPHYFNLNMACIIVAEAFPYAYGVYLVGSSLEKRDYRDVDVRLILPDDEFERVFPKVASYSTPLRSAAWSLMCAAISLYLSQHSGLPVDFQIQQGTQANRDEKGARAALGMFIHTPAFEPTTAAEGAPGGGGGE